MSTPAQDATIRASLLEAISEARREERDQHNHETTRAYWKQKADRWSRAMTTWSRASNANGKQDTIAEEGVRATDRPTRRTAQRRTGTR